MGMEFQFYKMKSSGDLWHISEYINTAKLYSQNGDIVCVTLWTTIKN